MSHSGQHAHASGPYVGLQHPPQLCLAQWQLHLSSQTLFCRIFLISVSARRKIWRTASKTSKNCRCFSGYLKYHPQFLDVLLAVRHILKLKPPVQHV